MCPINKFQINDEVCKILNIKRSVTSSYHPQTNVLDERTNQTLKVRLAKLANDHQDDWDEYLEDVAFSLRTQKQASTKYSPFYLMFGREARMPLQVRVNASKLDIQIFKAITYRMLCTRTS